MNSGDISNTAPVTVVIPTYNRADDLGRTLNALSLQTRQPTRVMVVDNSSTDHTCSVVKEQAGTWGERLGYVCKDPEGPASARNMGLNSAETKYVLFLDSDVELEPDWIATAVGHAEGMPGLVALGGYILYAFDTRRVNAYGGDLSLMGLAWDVAEGELLDRYRGPEDRIWINCSAMLADADFVRRAGGFDETFFYGFEDSDLGWRMNVMGGRVAVFPDLRARHHVEPVAGDTHPQIVFHSSKNRLRSVLKNASGKNLLPMLISYLGYSAADLLLRDSRWAKLRALGWNIRMIGDTWSQRRRVQGSRSVPDKRIFALGSRRYFPPVPLRGQRRRPVGDADVKTSTVRRGQRDDRV